MSLKWAGIMAAIYATAVYTPRYGTYKKKEKRKKEHKIAGQIPHTERAVFADQAATKDCITGC